MINDRLLAQLVNIAEAFKPHHIQWGVGASVLLSHYNLVDSPNDIDILVAEKNIFLVDTILSQFGNKTIRDKTAIFKTDFFYEYLIQGVEIDVMAGFKIKTERGIFEYQFNTLSTPHSFIVDNVEIPLMTLEDWYILYQLIPHKADKVEILKRHFAQNTIQYPQRLNDLLNNEVCLDLERLQKT